MEATSMDATSMEVIRHSAERIPPVEIGSAHLSLLFDRGLARIG
jgi:hypothetical protein